MTARSLAKLAVASMISKKATDISIMDIRKVTDTADYFVLCTADSDPQVRAIADAVEEATDEAGSRVWKSEGRDSLSWVILDFVDVVVHIFRRETRSFYNLERLWSDGKITHVGEDGEISAPAEKTRKPRQVSRSSKTSRNRTS